MCAGNPRRLASRGLSLWALHGHQSLRDLEEIASLCRSQSSHLLNGDANAPELCQAHRCSGGSIRAGHLRGVDVPLNRISAPPSLLQVTMGIAALGLLCATLLLPLLVFGVPTEEPSSGEAVASGSPGYCQRCCDSEDPLAPADEAVSSASPSALPYLLPEVRPYINITILKGEYPPVAQARLAWLGMGRAWGPLLGLGPVRWREQEKPR